MFLRLVCFLAFASSLFGQNAVILNTLPKSGSVYISSVIATSIQPYGYHFKRISQDRFHDDHIYEGQIIGAMRSKFVTQEHIDASPRNVQLLKKYCPKMVLNLRDPRQATLSWLHHVQKCGTSHHPCWSTDICPPAEYHRTWSFEQKVDWQIEHYLPAVVKWIEDWVAVIDSGEMDILVTRFEDLKANPHRFFTEILDFYNLPKKHLAVKKTEVGVAHFRKGEVAEWKRVMTKKQIQRMHEIIPVDLLKRFGWEL